MVKLYDEDDDGSRTVKDESVTGEVGPDIIVDIIADIVADSTPEVTDVRSTYGNLLIYTINYTGTCRQRKINSVVLTTLNHSANRLLIYHDVERVHLMLKHLAKLLHKL